ncbi:hypothetical protein [Candidatus Endomicrobiellum devescovinae]|jgi:hypothetical protein|uniref:hypothetical protein n=1 Tax=Candidatus Endomicrobiellum devescovinae TaxID=3242322 RepID=UPI002822C56D|nr:hypothetical protein [Endomicrobium sp.]
MATDLQVGTNTQVAPVRSDISLPSHDTPQIDLDTGKLISIDTSSKLDEQAIKESQSLSEKTSKYVPRKFWNGEIKKHFNELNPAQQKAWLDSFKIAEKSYAKMIEGMKDSYAQLDDVAGVLAPYVEEIMNVWGVSPATYIANLIEADKEASRNPVQYILKIMGAKGLTFSQLGAGVKPLMDDAENQAKLAPVMNKISELETKLLQQQQVTPSQTEDNLEYTSDVMAEEIREFFNQTDSSGRKLYPEWESLLNTILPMYLQGISLDEAYNAAVNDYKAKIPTNQTRVAPTPDIRDDSTSRAISGRESKTKEKQMLVNVIEQLKQNYE